MTHQVASDFRTPVWVRFEKDLHLRIQQLREMNDGLEKDQIKTTEIRSRISEVKRLLALSQENASASELPLMSEFDPSRE